MSKVTYFQRYTQKENVVTNNTLHLFSRINDYSRRKFERILYDIFDMEFDIGPNFTQQIRASTSVPDGIVSQSSFRILIETKVDAGINHDQLFRHLSSFGTEEKKMLLLLSKQNLNEDERDKIKKEIKKQGKDNIGFCSTTFEEVLNKIKSHFNQNIDTDFWPVLVDYEEFSRDMGLFDSSLYLMRSVPCGTSLHDNIKYGIYYMPENRSFAEHKIIGLYNKKAIKAIGEIKAIVLVNSSSEEKVKIEKGALDSQDREGINNIIESSLKNYGWDVSEGHRFFIVHEFILTDFKKESPGGLFGVKYFNLKKEINDIERKTIKIIADELNGRKWN